LKTANNIKDVDVRRDVAFHIREDFRRNLHVSDAGTVAVLLQEANRSLKMVSDMSSAQNSNCSSWIKSEDESDVRGRIGTGWPWNAS